MKHWSTYRVSFFSHLLVENSSHIIISPWLIRGSIRRTNSQNHQPSFEEIKLCQRVKPAAAELAAPVDAPVAEQLYRQDQLVAQLARLSTAYCPPRQFLYIYIFTRRRYSGGFDEETWCWSSLNPPPGLVSFGLAPPEPAQLEDPASRAHCEPFRNSVSAQKVTCTCPTVSPGRVIQALRMW